MSIISAALNDAAARKYDLEAWFPGYASFRELCSISNCTDYQSRSVNIRIRTDKQKDDEKKYVHMLNGTLCASERTLCCLLENYQTEKGVKVPDVLIPYMDTDFIPYVEELLPGYKPKKKGGDDGEKKDKKDKEKKKKHDKVDKEEGKIEVKPKDDVKQDINVEKEKAEIKEDEKKD